MVYEFVAYEWNGVRVRGVRVRGVRVRSVRVGGVRVVCGEAESTMVYSLWGESISRGARVTCGFDLDIMIKDLVSLTMRWQDVLDLHRLVQERYDTTSPKGYDLLLWGDLKILFEGLMMMDEIWKIQQDYNLISGDYLVHVDELEVDQESDLSSF
ncbi:hypothetical protein Tco_0179095 [Tanacetum coccineum]